MTYEVLCTKNVLHYDTPFLEKNITKKCIHTTHNIGEAAHCNKAKCLFCAFTKLILTLL